MKLNLLLTLLLLVSILSCKDKEPYCPPSEDLGELYWSMETEAWLPEEYFSLPHSLKYISENGEEKIFILDSSQQDFSSNSRTEVACESGEGSTDYRYSTQSYSGTFISEDSLSIFFALGVQNEVFSPEDRTEADFYEYVSMSMALFYDSAIIQRYGWIRVLTDLRNAELEDIEYTVDNYTFYDSLEVSNESFYDVYTDLTSFDPTINTLFKKGEGIIAFIDSDGILWKLDR